VSNNTITFDKPQPNVKAKPPSVAAFVVAIVGLELLALAIIWALLWALDNGMVMF
jgi:hypothetical protein